MTTFSFLNNCIWTAVSSGLGDFVVNAASQNGYTPANCLSPTVVNAATYHYFATNGAQHEEGDGAYTTATSTLARTTIRNSSTGAKINFTTPPLVFMGGPISTDMAIIAAPAAYSPTDQSGALLTFSSVTVRYCQIGKMVFIYGLLTYPVTADTSTAAISLPVTVANNTANSNAGAIYSSGAAVALTIIVAQQANAKAQFRTSAAGIITNVNLSGATIDFTLIYEAA